MSYRPGKRTVFSKREKKLLSIQDALSTILEKKGGKDRDHLNALWEHWDTVMGEDIAGLGYPLGHKKDVLLVGADDSMALQELSMQSYDILERANAFMDTYFFRSVKVLLMQGNRSLATPKKVTAYRKKAPPYIPPRPPRLGSLVGQLDPDSPIGQCYEAYVRFFNTHGKTS